MKFYQILSNFIRQRFEDSSSLLLSHQFSLLSTCTDVAQIPNFLIGDEKRLENPEYEALSPDNCNYRGPGL